MKVEVHLNDDSQPFVIEHAVNAYQKGRMYCVMQVGGTTQKYPFSAIFCVIEYNDREIQGVLTPYEKVEVLTTRQGCAMTFDKVCELNQRDGMYCLISPNGVLTGFPLMHIKRVIEYPVKDASWSISGKNQE